MKIISGGQTGVDRAALDIAIALNIAHGGWCPKGRLAEDGVIANHYQLLETPSDEYQQRTLWNIRDADATLIIVPKYPLTVNDGTILTIATVQSQKKLHIILDLSQPKSNEFWQDWLLVNSIHIINIAGPRESQSPGIYQASFDQLIKIFKASSHRPYKDATLRVNEYVPVHPDNFLK